MDMTQQPNETDDVFEKDDTVLLTENRNLKRQLIMNLAPKGAVPGSTSEKILLMGLINSMDQEIMTRTKIRIDRKSDKEGNDLRAIVANALLSCRPPKNKITEQDLLPPPDIKDRDALPGELDVGLIPLTIKSLD